MSSLPRAPRGWGSSGEILSGDLDRADVAIDPRSSPRILVSRRRPRRRVAQFDFRIPDLVVSLPNIAQSFPFCQLQRRSIRIMPSMMMFFVLVARIELGAMARRWRGSPASAIERAEIVRVLLVPDALSSCSPTRRRSGVPRIDEDFGEVIEVAVDGSQFGSVAARGTWSTGW